MFYRLPAWFAPNLTRGMARALAVAVGLSLYAALYALLRPTLGGAAGMPAALLVVACGWWGGARCGLVVGLLSTWMNAGLSFWLAGQDDLTPPVRLAAMLVFGAVGWAVGRLHDTRLELEHQLADKRRIARELTRAREELETKVRERTEALALANEALKLEIAERQEAEEAQVRLSEQRIALEQQLLRAQKMEAIGRLAGGVAHDFNNLLTAIIGFSELAAQHNGEAQQGAIAQINKAAERASELTRQLLAFARQKPVNSTAVDTNQVVAGAEKLLERLIGEDIRLVLSLGEGVWPVKVDAARLEQIVVNLAVNARDAMPWGGTLSIRTENTQTHEGDRVLITVSDTGTGMDEDTKARLFEPFFTTKGPGRGTGLGLATSYGIITQAGGEVRVHSQLGQGSTFEVDLPRAQEAAQTQSKDKISGTIVRGRERVLVVEDEPLVRAMMEITLVDQGFEVFCADTPARALEVARMLRKLDAVITDVILPGQNGHELARAVRELIPDVAVLYVSGYTRETINERGVPTSDGGFLAKPFAPRELSESLQAVLEQRAALLRARAGAPKRQSR